MIYNELNSLVVFPVGDVINNYFDAVYIVRNFDRTGRTAITAQLFFKSKAN